MKTSKQSKPKRKTTYRLAGWYVSLRELGGISRPLALCLKKNKILCMGHLLPHTMLGLLGLPGMGPVRYKTLLSFLESRGIPTQDLRTPLYVLWLNSRSKSAKTKLREVISEYESYWTKTGHADHWRAKWFCA